MKNRAIEKAIAIAGGQAQLSDKSGVSQAPIHKHLSGKTKDIRGVTARKLSNATGIPFEEFSKINHLFSPLSAGVSK